MKKHQALLATVIVILGVSIFQVTTANESNVPVISADGVKSLAYYVANIKAARTTNQQCYDQGLDMKSVPDCANALQALEMSHVGGERAHANQFAGR